MGTGKREIIVGAFVLGAVALLLIGLSYLRQRSVLATSNIYHCIYDNVDGVTKGDKVLINGYPVGQVTELIFDPVTAKIAVYFDVDRKIKVPKDSKAVVASFDFFGSKCIRLVPGKDAQIAGTGDLLVGNIEKGMIEEVKSEVLPVKDKIEKVIEDIQVMTSSLKQHFNDSTGKFNNIVKNVDVTTGNVAVISSDFRTTVKKINYLTDSLNGLVATVKAYDPKVKTILNNAGTITEEFKSSTADLKSIISNAKTSTEDLKLMMNKINSGQGTLGQLMNDKRLYENLNSSAKSLDSLLTDLRMYPKRYVQFSLIGRKDR